MENFPRLLTVILFHTVGFGAASIHKVTFPHESKHIKSQFTSWFDMESNLLVFFSNVVCDVETINAVDYEIFYPIYKFRNKTNPNCIEMKVKFKGVSDGHIALTSTQDVSQPHYVVSIHTIPSQVTRMRLHCALSTVGFRLWQEQ